MSQGSRHGATWNKLRLACLARDNYICGYCGAEANEADHIIPVAAGGKDELSNLIAACKPCNGRKSDKMMVRMNWFNNKWISSLHTNVG